MEVIDSVDSGNKPMVKSGKNMEIRPVRTAALDSPKSGRSTPEAKLGLRVEDLWDIQEPQLTPSEKLNSCFDSLPVSSFPPAASSQVVEINSDASLAEAVQILSKNNVLSAPVRNVEASDDDSWMDRYIGIVEFAGIAVWLLHQSEIAPVSGEGSFFENLTTSDIYRNTKVQDISGSFRWAPFLALQTSDSFLTMLLLLSKYRMKSLPVIDWGEEKISNVITQSGVVHMLAECVGLHWFEIWGKKKLSDVGLPSMKPSQVLKVGEDEPVLEAFRLMRKKRIGGLPVVDSDGKKAVGNISIRDLRFLLTMPEIYKDYRSLTAKNFLTAARGYLMENEESSPMLAGTITCQKSDTIKDVILKLDSAMVHRIYVVDAEENLEGVITLRDIISKLVHEPRGYFGDFFDGVVPMPATSSV